MSAPKWTPGPWDYVTGLGGVVKGGFIYPLPVSDERMEGESWLEMRQRTEPERVARSQEAEANSALQRAAPELYEALETVLECGSVNDQWWVDKAKAALAKARGEQ